MHRIAGGAAAMSAATIIAFVADASTQPHSLALPILTVVFIVSGIVWVLTRPKESRPDAEGGSGSEGGQGGDAASQKSSGDYSPNIVFRESPVTVNPPPTVPEIALQAPGVPLNRAIADALTELDAIRRRLEEAAKSGRLAVLPAHHHQPLADLMADHGWVESRRILDGAYNACDALQHQLKNPSRRWDPDGPKEPRIQESDDLPGVQRQVAEAINTLERLQRGDGPSKPAERRQTWEDVRTRYATWSDVKQATVPLWQDLEAPLTDAIKEGRWAWGDGFTGSDYGAFSEWTSRTATFIEAVFGQRERELFAGAPAPQRIDRLRDLLDRLPNVPVVASQSELEGAIRNRDPANLTDGDLYRFRIVWARVKREN